MRRSFRLGSILSLCGLLSLAIGACGSDETPTSGAGAAGKAGAAGNAGNASTAGASGKGGGPAGSAGVAGAAGNVGAAGNAGTAGAAGSAGAAGAAACTDDADCGVLATKPVKCADAKCVTGACVFSAKDADGDGHRTTSCAPVDGSIVVALGDDCDDADPAVHPGAWDGPQEGAKASACNDGVDQDCSGKPDDGKTASGQTCSCTPGDVQPCTETADGKPIAYPKLVEGLPIGECKRGSKICLANGTFGVCNGGQGPVAESCNGKDDDCDGEKDEAGATDERYFLWDGDNDLHAAKGYKTFLGCAPPPTPPAECPTCVYQADAWKPNIPADDCEDGNQSVFPGATEICDGTDNDCDGQIDEGNVAPAVWALDADGDNHGDKNTPTVAGCTAPGPLYRANIVNDDCNDADANVHPAAPERCNGRDDRCSGVSDDVRYALGQACDVKGIAVGACKAAGKWACELTGERACVSPDELIGKQAAFVGAASQDHPAPNGSSDWNCDDKLVCDLTSPENLASKYTLSSPFFCPDVANQERAKCVAYKPPNGQDLCSFATKRFLCAPPAAGAGIQAIQCVSNGAGGCKVGSNGNNGLSTVGTMICE